MHFKCSSNHNKKQKINLKCILYKPIYLKYYHFKNLHYFKIWDFFVITAFSNSGVYFILFIYFFWFILFYCIFLLPFILLILPPHWSHHTVVHVHESIFLFAWSLHPLIPLHIRHLAVYESVSILRLSSVCSATYEWNHMVFVFLWLAYFT